VQITDKVVVVSGGGRGIGRALCEEFARAGAAHVVVSDLCAAAAEEVATSISGSANQCDVACEADVVRLIDETYAAHGRIDVFCANAGITMKGGVETPNADWQRMWDVNLMSRVYTARHLVPRMMSAGGGYFISTASGAALLTEIGSASYSVTKHADLAFAEWLAITYGREGLRVSCLCPLGVDTGFLDHEDPIHRYLADTAITSTEVAQAVIEAVDAERFLITPHPRLADFFELKSRHYDRYIVGMQKMRQKWGGKVA
jgi:NAD(P)-dependent dehydrogenase (short-subunit alcohol dehydrogenase family)